MKLYDENGIDLLNKILLLPYLRKKEIRYGLKYIKKLATVKFAGNKKWHVFFEDYLKEDFLKEIPREVLSVFNAVDRANIYFDPYVRKFLASCDSSAASKIHVFLSKHKVPVFLSNKGLSINYVRFSFSGVIWKSLYNPAKKSLT